MSLLVRRRAAASLISFSLLAACGGRPDRSNDGAAPHPTRVANANVLLVTIDTLRADRLGAYGSARGLTPTLDRLAAQGIRYARAFSHVPMTLPAHAAILSGQLPRRNGVRNNTGFRLDDRVPTLATLLKTAGYRTGAFVGAFVLDARFGLNRGFDVYDDRLPHAEGASFHFVERRADEVLTAAANWILTRSSSPQSPAPNPRWFAWVHLFDPHTPYAAPPEYREGRAPYDAEVAYTDAALGRFLDRLRAAGQLERTVVVVTADHGESLGEHGETTHGLFAYDSTIHVPLVISFGGGASGRAGTVNEPVAHVDLLPTILDIVGAPAPNGIDGQSLTRTPAPDRPLYFEALDAYLTRGWAPLRGVVSNGWKYIDLPEAELYDLASDPAEARNRAGVDRHDEVLRRALAQFEATPEAAAPAPPIDAQAASRLRSLGYVGGSAPSKPNAAGLNDDPKRLVALNERFNTALTAFDEGRAAEALHELSAILAARPDFLAARTSAATVLIGEGRGGQAAQLLREAPPDQRTSPEVLLKLAAALRADGDLRGAATALEQARHAAPDNVDALADLGVVYAALGRSEAARALFRELVTRYPSSATGWYNLGLFELQNRKPAAAADALRQAVDRDPAYGDAWHALGAALVSADPRAAIDAWRHAEPLRPRDYDLLFNLAMLSAESDKPAEAIPYLRRFADEAPRDRYAADITRVRQVLARLEKRPS